MNIYKTIDIPNWQATSELVYQYIKQHEEIYTTKNTWVWFDFPAMLEAIPQIEQSLAAVGLSVGWLSILSCKPAEGFHLHADGYEPTNPGRVRILWPIKNCEGSQTNFYRVPREDLEFYTAPDHDNPDNPANSYNYNGMEFKLAYYRPKEGLGPYEQIDGLSVLSPMVFDSSIAHQVISNPAIAEPRFTMTIQTNENLEGYLSDSFGRY